MNTSIPCRTLPIHVFVFVYQYSTEGSVDEWARCHFCNISAARASPDACSRGARREAVEQRWANGKWAMWGNGGKEL